MIYIVLISMLSCGLANHEPRSLSNNYWQPIVHPNNKARCVGSFFCGLDKIDYGRVIEECVPAVKVCDGINDCRNGGDEKHCPPQCFNGILCNDKKTCGTPCDGKRDCSDGQDENNCAPSCQCDGGFFKCLNEDRCLPVSKVCDGHKDCFHGNDEEDCSPSCLCGTGRYLCIDDVSCIRPDQFCDGSKACEHEDDEEHCPATCFCSPGQYICNTFTDDEGPTCISKDEVCNLHQDCPGADALCTDIEGSGAEA